MEKPVSETGDRAEAVHMIEVLESMDLEQESNQILIVVAIWSGISIVCIRLYKYVKHNYEKSLKKQLYMVHITANMQRFFKQKILAAVYIWKSQPEFYYWKMLKYYQNISNKTR